MKELVFVLLGLVLFGGLFFVIVYNGLVGKRNMVRNAFSSIDVNLKKRADLVPNLVSTVKGYAKHEQETLTRVIELRNRISEAKDDSERFRLEGQLGPEMGRLFALSESYPELRSNENFLNLQRNLTEIEEQISAARRAYNAAVLEMNNAVESFPSNIIANMFHFVRHDFFEASESDRASQQVGFD
ncbi:MAG: LemA family protein [Verrucomicrobiales bacterium]|nr:LemA family protein [Verrucomicrobiales bacterium]